MSMTEKFTNKHDAEVYCKLVNGFIQPVFNGKGYTYYVHYKR